MKFMETITVYSEIYVMHLNTVYGQKNVCFLNDVTGNTQVFQTGIDLFLNCFTLQRVHSTTITTHITCYISDVSVAIDTPQAADIFTNHDHKVQVITKVKKGTPPLLKHRRKKKKKQKNFSERQHHILIIFKTRL